jgi:hypothetical protein
MRLRTLLLGLTFVAAGCSGVNLRAVEKTPSTTASAPAPPTTAPQEAEVLGNVVVAPSAELVPPTPETPREVREVQAETVTTESSALDPPTEAEGPDNSATTEPREPEPRLVIHQNFEAYATVGGFTLYLPAKEVELVGFHESNHDGAQQVEPVEVITPMETMETRDRGNGSRTAMDIAMNRSSEIRSPVTGTVVRAGTYTLYCQYSDDYAVIAPDEQPAWEVKILHIDGVKVRKGDRVIARETVLAPAPTRLPFNSQIDKLTAYPPPPHVHIEVVDPSIPDRPSGGC